MLSHALAYLKRNKSVIPVGKDKRPLIDWKEYQKRLPTMEEVREWWTKWEDANIGIVTGKVSDITVIDIDKKSGGLETLKGLKLPITTIVKTGGGGFHYYYKYADIGNKAGIYQGVDIRGNGGYVVAPPSVHESGVNYKFSINEEIADFPMDLFNIEKASNDWEELLGGVGSGKRNESAAKVIGKLLPAFDRGLWGSAVWQIVRSWNANNKPPMDEAELKITFESIVRKESSKNSKTEDIEDVEIKTFKEVAESIEEQRDNVYYSTGFNEFDEVLLGGLMSGDLVVVTAPTGQGKTSFAQTLTYNLSTQKVPSLWFSYEVMVTELWRKFKNMGFDTNLLSYIPLKHPTGKLDWIKKKITEGIDKFDIKTVFIDHLGFLLPGGEYNGSLSQNYSAYLGSICRDLKTFAIEKEIVIVLMVHIRKSDSPSIEDIRDSSSIAQESDIVFILSRIKEDKSKKDYNSDESFDLFSDETRISIEKNRRTGASKSIKAKMIKDRFVGNNYETNIEDKISNLL